MSRNRFYYSFRRASTSSNQIDIDNSKINYALLPNLHLLRKDLKSSKIRQSTGSDLSNIREAAISFVLPSLSRLKVGGKINAFRRITPLAVFIREQRQKGYKSEGRSLASLWSELPEEVKYGYQIKANQFTEEIHKMRVEHVNRVKLIHTSLYQKAIEQGRQSFLPFLEEQMLQNTKAYKISRERNSLTRLMKAWRTLTQEQKNEYKIRAKQQQPAFYRNCLLFGTAFDFDEEIVKNLPPRATTPFSYFAKTKGLRPVDASPMWKALTGEEKERFLEECREVNKERKTAKEKYIASLTPEQQMELRKRAHLIRCLKNPGRLAVLDDLNLLGDETDDELKEG